jgi:hypothetical protein
LGRLKPGRAAPSRRSGNPAVCARTSSEGIELLLTSASDAFGAKLTFDRICMSLKVNNRLPSEHNNVVDQ